jgi:sugar phosphate isomerase/epimerase
MGRQIVLHQFNAPDASLVELIGMASANGCDRVSIFGFDGATVLPPRNASLAYPQAVTPGNRREVMQAMADHGVSLDGIEFFPITADVDFEVYRPALAQAREMGASRAVSHIFIEDDAQVIDRLGKFCELAGAEGLKVSTEFCPMTPGNPSLARAMWLVDQIGADNFGIGLDVLHLIRSGGSPADVAALDPRTIAAVQICDARGTHASTDYMADVHNREVPGHGDLPIREFLKAVPASFPIEVEVPAAHRRAAGVTAAEHVRDVLAGARAIVETLGRA